MLPRVCDARPAPTLRPSVTLTIICLTAVTVALMLPTTAFAVAPTASFDSYATAEDTTLTVAAPGVLANDTDPDGPLPLVAVLVAGGEPANGTLTLNLDGGFVYVPAPDYYGSDVFWYRAFDGLEYSGTTPVLISVSPVNDAPTGVPDFYTVDEDSSLVVGPTGVLANDTDPEGDPLSAVLVAPPLHGAFALLPDGSFVYTPTADFTGVDFFTYRARDASLMSDVTVVQIIVNNTPDPPTANPDSYAATEDTPLNVPAPGVLANDTDPDPGFVLTAVLESPPAYGTLTLNPDGSFDYEPALDYWGPDEFTYHAFDGGLSSNVTTVTLTVAAVNDAPVANDDTYDATEETLLVVPAPGVLGNDTDVEGDAFIAELVTPPARGLLTFDADGSFTYLPSLDFVGADTFTYRARDAAVSAPATVTINVANVNDAPVAHDDGYSTPEGTPLNVPPAGVLANDTDVDGDPLVAILVTDPALGSVLLSADGSFTYTPPDSDYVGTDTFTYRARDAALDSNDATVTITMTPVNDPPVANPDTYDAVEDTVLNVPASGVLGNDIDVDGDPLTAALVAGASHGSVTLNPDGSFTYTPYADCFGPDSFTYVANDGTADSNVATVTLNVANVNDAPVAAGDTYAATEDTLLTVAAPGVLGNDSDVDGDPLGAFVVTPPAHGLLVLAANGGFTYLPDADYFGPDSFTYRANDGAADSAPATVDITIAGVNDAPRVVGDAYSTPFETQLVVAAPGVLANDSDPEGDPFEVEGLISPTIHGTVVLNADGSFTYTPNAGFSGADSFTYRAWDYSALSEVVTVLINVGPQTQSGMVLSRPISRFIVRRNRRFVVYGWMNQYRQPGTYPVTLQCFHYENGVWILVKSVPMRAYQVKGGRCKYAGYITLPYRGKWSLVAEHQLPGMALDRSTERILRVR